MLRRRSERDLSMMLDREPLNFPSRVQFPCNPGVADRQLWALGMIVVQWSMFESLVEQEIEKLAATAEERMNVDRKTRGFGQRIEFWETLIKKSCEGPMRDLRLSLVLRGKDLGARRDEVIHRSWAGGMQAGTWSSESYSTTDASLLRKSGELSKSKSNDANSLLRWKLTFYDLKRLAKDLSELNCNMCMVGIDSS